MLDSPKEAAPTSAARGALGRPGRTGAAGRRPISSATAIRATMTAPTTPNWIGLATNRNCANCISASAVEPSTKTALLTAKPTSPSHGRGTSLSNASMIAIGTQMQATLGESGTDPEPGDRGLLGEAVQAEIGGVEQHLVDRPLLEQGVRRGEHDDDRPSSRGAPRDFTDEQRATAVHRREEHQRRKCGDRLIAQDELTDVRREQKQPERKQPTSAPDWPTVSARPPATSAERHEEQH